MIKVDISAKDLITGQLKSIQQQLRAVPQQAHKKYQDLTPVDTGHARRSTRLVNNRQIQADYAYAEVLDRGRHLTRRGMRGSRQAPKGMTQPWERWYRALIRKIFGR